MWKEGWPLLKGVSIYQTPKLTSGTEEGYVCWAPGDERCWGWLPHASVAFCRLFCCSQVLWGRDCPLTLSLDSFHHSEVLYHYQDFLIFYPCLCISCYNAFTKSSVSRREWRIAQTRRGRPREPVSQMVGWPPQHQRAATLQNAQSGLC